MSRSWIDEIRTKRKYKIFSDPSIIWEIINEFQIVNCPHCNETQYCRLTRIYILDAQNTQIVKGFEIHTNYHKNLDELKKLLVKYASGNDSDSGIKEEMIDGIWRLTLKREINGEEIK